MTNNQVSQALFWTKICACLCTYWQSMSDFKHDWFITSQATCHELPLTAYWVAQINRSEKAKMYIHIWINTKLDQKLQVQLNLKWVNSIVHVPSHKYYNCIRLPCLSFSIYTSYVKLTWKGIKLSSPNAHACTVHTCIVLKQERPHKV